MSEFKQGDTVYLGTIKHGKVEVLTLTFDRQVTDVIVHVKGDGVWPTLKRSVQRTPKEALAELEDRLLGKLELLQEEYREMQDKFQERIVKVSNDLGEVQATIVKQS